MCVFSARSKCTANNFQTFGEKPCAFCYAAGSNSEASCVQVDPTSLSSIGAPCGKDKDNNDEANPFSYGVGGDCDCAQGYGTNVGGGSGPHDDGCSACANLAHPGCVWVESGKQNIEVSIYNPLTGNPGIKTQVPVWTNKTCKSANDMIGTTVYTVSTSGGSPLLEVSFSNENTQWYWEQCTLPKFWYLVVLLGGLLCGLACLCTVVACACRRCRARQSRGVQYAVYSSKGYTIS